VMPRSSSRACWSRDHCSWMKGMRMPSMSILSLWWT